MPLAVEDKRTRHTFRKVRCGAHAELFLLDVRGMSLGRFQSEWLVSEVTASPCAWKFIVCPNSLAFTTARSVRQGEDAGPVAGVIWFLGWCFRGEQDAFNEALRHWVCVCSYV